MNKKKKAGLLFNFGDILHFNNVNIKGKVNYSEKLITIGYLLQLFEVEEAESKTVNYLIKKRKMIKMNDIILTEEELLFLKIIKDYTVSMLVLLVSRIMEGLEMGDLENVCEEISNEFNKSTMHA